MSALDPRTRHTILHHLVLSGGLVKLVFGRNLKLPDNLGSNAGQKKYSII